tara:strand:+ start:2518 stop:3933 length:1416 start_codon:yes stop_codon:yes gene_type:complete
MAFGNPSQGQIDAISTGKAAKSTSQAADVRIGRGEGGYIFASGILEPEHSDFLSYQYPQYLATAILERIGRYEGIGQDVFSWSEMDRTRLGATITEISTLSGANAASVTVSTDFTAAAAGDGYFLVGDTVRSETGTSFRVTNVAEAGGVQTITITKVNYDASVGSTNINPSGVEDIANGDQIGHIGSVFGEYSDAPQGRLYLPNERYNQLQVTRRSTYISGKALTNRTYLNGGKSWAYEQELIEMDEFARDRENTIMFEHLSASGTDTQTTEGIVTAILKASGGITSQYAGGVNEAAIQAHITALRISSPATEYVVFCGMEFLSDAHAALKEYHTGGAINYGSFGSANMVGISLNAYKFMDCTIHFVHYPTFDDAQTLPHTGDPTATKINYSNFSLWLNLGSQRGNKLISLKYKELDGQQRKFMYKYEDGMMGDTAKVANGKDGVATHMLSDIAVCVRNLNQHGALYSISA